MVILHHLSCGRNFESTLVFEAEKPRSSSLVRLGSKSPILPPIFTPNTFDGVMTRDRIEGITVKVITRKSSRFNISATVRDIGLVTMDHR